jgi:hypothetical protein
VCVIFKYDDDRAMYTSHESLGRTFVASHSTITNQRFFDGFLLPPPSFHSGPEFMKQVEFVDELIVDFSSPLAASFEVVLDMVIICFLCRARRGHFAIKRS